MFHIIPLYESDRLEKLEDLATPFALDRVLRDASKLSLRLGVNVYIYNFADHRTIKKFSCIDFIDKKIDFAITKDNRIAAEGADRLSGIILKDKAIKYFKRFQELGLNIFKDKSGIYYFEKEILPYHILKRNMTTFKDISRWNVDDWMFYIEILDKCPLLRMYARHMQCHTLYIRRMDLERNILS